MLLLVDEFINFPQLDQLDLDDAEDDWDLEREFPYEDSGNDRDVWVDLEEGRREEDEEDEDEDVETAESRQFPGSPTRRASYTQYYNARLRSPVQVAGGGRHPPPPVRPRRSHRRRSGQYYGPHHYSQASPLYHRGRGQGAGRYRLGATEDGWGLRQFR